MQWSLSSRVEVQVAVAAEADLTAMEQASVEAG
jgi:hypothetical protein